MIAIKEFYFLRKNKHNTKSKGFCIIKKSKYSAKFLMLLMIGNLILLFFIAMENQVLHPMYSPWIYVKDFFTLNLAIYAIVKDKIIRYKIYAVLVNQEGRPKEGLDGICEYTVFLNSVGEQPYFVEISNVDILIDGVPSADYICEVRSSPEMDYNNIVRSLPLYLSIKIGTTHFNCVKTNTGKISGNFLLQYSQTTERFKMSFPITCKLGDEGIDLQ